MSIEYLGLSSINGPLIVLEGVQDAFYDEIVEFVVDGTTQNRTYCRDLRRQGSNPGLRRF